MSFVLCAGGCGKRVGKSRLSAALAGVPVLSGQERRRPV
jgi:hypothetical protein